MIAVEERRHTEKAGDAGFVHDLQQDLHDLCQPLAALLCRLELGQMSGGLAELSDAVAGGLVEMKRVDLHLATLRRRLAQAETDR